MNVSIQTELRVVTVTLSKRVCTEQLLGQRWRLWHAVLISHISGYQQKGNQSNIDWLSSFRKKSEGSFNPCSHFYHVFLSVSWTHLMNFQNISCSLLLNSIETTIIYRNLRQTYAQWLKRLHLCHCFYTMNPRSDSFCRTVNWKAN